MLELTEVEMRNYKTTASGTRYYRSTGLSIIELMIGLAVAAILLMIGVPSMQETIKNNRVSSQTNELLSIVQYARSEAIRGNENTRVGLRSRPDGWLAEVWICTKDNPSCDVSSSNNKETLRRVSYQGVNLISVIGDVEFTLDGRGALITSTTRQFALEVQDCTAKHKRQRRDFEIFLSGQLDVENAACGA